MKEKSVLVVDDDQITREILSAELKSVDCVVTLAASGEEALELIAHERFDLVVTDLAMGGVNGIEVLKVAKSKDSGTGVFILTGYGDMSSAIDALRLGADDYLLKPCDNEEFILRMKRFFEQQEAFRKLRLYEEILPVCCVCGDIRDDEEAGAGQEHWLNLSEFICKKTSVRVTHTFCPQCYEKQMKLVD